MKELSHHAGGEDLEGTYHRRIKHCALKTDFSHFKLIFHCYTIDVLKQHSGTVDKLEKRFAAIAAATKQQTAEVDALLNQYEKAVRPL